VAGTAKGAQAALTPKQLHVQQATQNELARIQQMEPQMLARKGFEAQNLADKIEFHGKNMSEAAGNYNRIVGGRSWNKLSNDEQERASAQGWKIKKESEAARGAVDRLMPESNPTPPGPNASDGERLSYLRQLQQQRVGMQNSLAKPAPFGADQTDHFARLGQAAEEAAPKLRAGAANLQLHGEMAAFGPSERNPNEFPEWSMQRDSTPGSAKMKPSWLSQSALGKDLTDGARNLQNNARQLGDLTRLSPDQLAGLSSTGSQDQVPPAQARPGNARAFSVVNPDGTLEPGTAQRPPLPPAAQAAPPPVETAAAPAPPAPPAQPAPVETPAGSSLNSVAQSAGRALKGIGEGAEDLAKGGSMSDFFSGARGAVTGALGAAGAGLSAYAIHKGMREDAARGDGRPVARNRAIAGSIGGAAIGGAAALLLGPPGWIGLGVGLVGGYFGSRIAQSLAA
jgi:hypothetical protein